LEAPVPEIMDIPFYVHDPTKVGGGEFFKIDKVQGIEN
jgi:hypothetical protein